MSAIKPQIKSFLVHRTVGTMLAYLNSHTNIVLVVVFTLVHGIVHGSICLHYKKVHIYTWGVGGVNML